MTQTLIAHFVLPNWMVTEPHPKVGAVTAVAKCRLVLEMADVFPALSALIQHHGAHNGGTGPHDYSCFERGFPGYLYSPRGA